MLNDIMLFAINGGGWALKPILEKISVDKMGYFYFTFIRYFVSGIIALPFMFYQYQVNGIPKKYNNNSFNWLFRKWKNYNSILFNKTKTDG